MDLCALCCILLWGFVAALSTALPLALLDIQRRGYSKALTWTQLLKLYVLLKLGDIKTYRLHRKFERDVRQFEKAQSEFLLERIRRCKNTAFGRDYHLPSYKTVDEFRRSFPVCDFSNVEEYINRMANGEKNAFLGDEDELVLFSASSGTTGKNKLIPVTVEGAKSLQDQVLFGAYQWALRERFPWDLTRILTVKNSPLVHKPTKAGHKVGVVSSVIYSKLNEMTTLLTTTPPLSLPMKNESVCNYIHALFGLRDKHISMIRNGYIFQFLTLIRGIKMNQKSLVEDIRRGQIKEDLDIDEKLRSEINAHLSPMPERAAELEKEFAKGFDGLIPRVWPKVTRISGIWSGNTNAMYYKEARAMLGPNIPIFSFSLMASEGFLGANLELTRPGPPRYTLIPDAVYYEFLPIVGDHIPELADIRPQDLLLGHQLEVGKEYEMFITNPSGLFRYRLGDVVRVAGFYQQAPQVEFLYRSGQLLNVCGEKMIEDVFFRALEDAAKRWPSTLKDYTVASSQLGPADQDELSRRYLLFLELEGEPLTAEQVVLVDRTLQEQCEEYRVFRSTGRLGEMAVYQMPVGTFARFQDHLVKTTTVSAAQFKMPRVLKSADRVQWFMENVRA
ncbi:probable indole-3-acetic acid-amido synthetase GH3.9 isoform X1 [Amphibalanus amphitrite]|uniref:probable indole-3-acetic acid-amido synthetase GH3.9 isoform X1 n=2 Tax=Amphibalanus amphitrite TaxID=1232801 RepID=UPI001C8FAFD6|nr:probable indole-3-acetic acid-amido synthetase GH3.9 isoform X1 [Amphibalanus amphitrite]